MMFKLTEIDDVLNNLGDHADFATIAKKEPIWAFNIFNMMLLLVPQLTLVRTVISWNGGRMA